MRELVLDLDQISVQKRKTVREAGGQDHDVKVFDYESVVKDDTA